MEEQRKFLSPFHTYAFAECLFREYVFFFGRRGIPEFYVISDEKKVLMICPVIRKMVNGQSSYASFGANMLVVEEDFLYPDGISDECIFQCLCTLLNEIGKVSFERASPDSRIYSVALQKGMICHEEKKENALIELPENYEDYFHQLSRSMRGTIRCAQNRLASDGLKDEIKIFYGHTMPKLQYLLFTTVYARSKEERYSVHRNLIGRFSHWMYVVFFHHHAQALNKVESSVCVVYRINHHNAAVLGGYLDKAKKRVYWHRFGFISRYARYSPGILLLQKTIKQMIAETDIRLFDLSIGGEKYKYRIGAEIYYDRCFDIVPAEQMKE